MINWTEGGRQEGHFITVPKKNTTNMESRVSVPWFDYLGVALVAYFHIFNFFFLF